MFDNARLVQKFRRVTNQIKTTFSCVSIFVDENRTRIVTIFYLHFSPDRSKCQEKFWAIWNDTTLFRTLYSIKCHKFQRPQKVYIIDTMFDIGKCTDYCYSRLICKINVQSTIESFSHSYTGVLFTIHYSHSRPFVHMRNPESNAL